MNYSVSHPVPEEIEPDALAERLSNATLQLVDVREPWEAAITSIPGSRLIPLGSLARSLDQLDPDRPVVLYCHHGARSGMALAMLRQNGFPDAQHLAGGIEAYATQVDPSLPRY